MDNDKKNSINKIVDKIDMDNGYFPYAQDIGRVLAKTYLNGSHRAILDCIFSKTFGYPDKKSNKIEKIKRRIIEKRITCREFEDFTRIKRNHIPKYIKEFVAWKIVKRRKRGQYYLYSFNVIVSQWNKGIFERTVPQTRDTIKVSPDRGLTVPQTMDTLSHKRGTLTGSGANNNKAFPDTNKSFNKNYIKKREKDHIINKNYLGKEEEEIKEIFDYWNTYGINPRTKIKPYIQDIKEALKEYSRKEIQLAISNYAYIRKGEEYYLDHDYDLDSFLRAKNIEKFLDLEKAKSCYLKKVINNNQTTGEEEYNIPDYKAKIEKDDKTTKEIKAERNKISDLAGREARKLRNVLKDKG